MDAFENIYQLIHVQNKSRREQESKFVSSALLQKAV